MKGLANGRVFETGHWMSGFGQSALLEKTGKGGKKPGLTGLSTPDK
jgi:hypothetical protein